MSTASGARSSGDDADLVAALRAGDETAFAELIDAYDALLLRVAGGHVSTRAVAEEVVQETWLAVLEGVDRFEARSSLKRWIIAIAANIARTRAVREWRCLPFSSLAGGETDLAGRAADAADRFVACHRGRAVGPWARQDPAVQSPAERLESAEVRDVIFAAIRRLPPAQRLVVTLRDVEGRSADEACDALDVTDGHQRVLLHRARAQVRHAVEHHLGDAGLAA